MARILGLDLGSYSVKGVVFESAMRGYQVKAYEEVKRPAWTNDAERLESLKAAVTELVARPELRADQVVISLPGPALATHLLSMPFTDTKRIEAALPFEVESQLPFDLDQAVFDYQIASQPDGKRSELLIGLVKRDELQTLLEVLGGLKIDPRIVTHPAVAYQNLLQAASGAFDAAAAAPAAEDGAAPAPSGPLPVAIIDLGHERTNVAIGRPGVGLDFARTLSGGGRDLSRALAGELQVPLAEATEWKETQGAIGPAADGPESVRAAGAFHRGLQPILRELRSSLKSYTARNRANVSKVYLCGGTSRLPGLAAQLERDLGLPVQLLDLPLEASSAINADAAPAAAQAFALALRGQASGSKAPRFNLRRGPFAFKGDFDWLREKIPLLSAFAAVLLLMFIATGVARNRMLANREEQIDNALCDVTQRVLGKCEKNFDRALSMLHGKESPAAAIPKKSAVVLLAELIQKIPNEVPVTFEEVRVELNRVGLKVKTDSAKQVDKLSAALKAHRCVKKVTEGRVDRSKDGTSVTVRIDIEVACADDASAAASL
jgi:general secretion pathway protein L